MLLSGDPSEMESESESARGGNIQIKYWCWVVVAASFFNIAVIDGVGYTTGILLDSLLEELGGGRGAIAVIGSLQVGIYSLSGPLVGRMILHFGPRSICMTGALIACLGMFAASFASNLCLVLICYSILSGFGFGMMYIPSVVGVAPYFTDKRAFAIGICLCGSGVGTFALAPISSYVLELYGWRWVFRMLSFICIISIFCGASMIPMDGVNENEDEKEYVSTSQRRSRRRGVTQKLLSLLLGEELAFNRNLGIFIVITLADFLAFTAIYIPYTHLPPLAKESFLSEM